MDRLLKYCAMSGLTPHQLRGVSTHITLSAGQKIRFFLNAVCRLRKVERNGGERRRT